MGRGAATEPALKVDSPNGDRTLILVYDSGKGERATAGDCAEGHGCSRCVCTCTTRCIRRACWRGGRGLRTSGKQTVTIEQAASGTWNLPAGTRLHVELADGAVGGEWQLHTAASGSTGAQVLESRRGSTGHQANPWFAIGRGGGDDGGRGAGLVW